MTQVKSKQGILGLLKKIWIVGVILLKLFFVLLLAGGGMMIVFDKMGIPSETGAIIASQASMLLFGIFLYDFKRKPIFNELQAKITKEVIFKALIATICVLILNVILGLLIQTSGEVSETVDILTNKMNLFSAILLPVIIAPFFEELAFRGGLKYILIDNNGFSKISYIIISAVIFGSLHYQPSPLALTHVLLTGGMGAIYAIFYLKTKNIYVSIISHSLYNGLVMLIAFSIN